LLLFFILIISLLILIFQNLALIKSLIIITNRLSRNIIDFILNMFILFFILFWISLTTANSMIKLWISNLNLSLFRWRSTNCSLPWNWSSTIV
jgi:hypothetical protein